MTDNTICIRFQKNPNDTKLSIASLPEDAIKLLRIDIEKEHTIIIDKVEHEVKILSRATIRITSEAKQFFNANNLPIMITMPQSDKNDFPSGNYMLSGCKELGRHENEDGSVTIHYI